MAQIKFLGLGEPEKLKVSQEEDCIYLQNL